MNQYVKRPDTGHTGASANTRSYTGTPSVGYLLSSAYVREFRSCVKVQVAVLPRP